MYLTEKTHDLVIKFINRVFIITILTFILLLPVILFVSEQSIEDYFGVILIGSGIGLIYSLLLLIVGYFSIDPDERGFLLKDNHEILPVKNKSI